MDDSAKQHAHAFIDRNIPALNGLSDTIFYYGELGMQEHRTAALLTAVLEQAGFAVERNLSGFPTGFLAQYGAGDPVIAMHFEYDSVPNNSQVPGRTERAEIVPGAPGHCEGHNVNAAVVIAAALAVMSAMKHCGIPGTLKVFGAPAEEQLISRPYYVRDGHFDDVDIAFHAHILDEFGTQFGLLQLSLISAEFLFTGVASHSAMSPWKGRDALDAAVLMDVGMAQFREHMMPGMFAHRVMPEAGVQPNVIPSRASCWWFFRNRSAAGAQELFQNAERIARGAAMMANCGLETRILAGVWPVLANETVANVLQGNIESVGMPEWTAEEQAFAEEVQRNADVAAAGLRREITPLMRQPEPIAASNDCGDISWVVPMGRLWFPSNIPHAAFHHWSGGAALTTSIAHKGALAGSKALAGAALDFMAKPELVAEAWTHFERDIAGTAYRSLLQKDQTPPVELNRTLMEKFRPAMEAHYPQSDGPKFVFNE